MVREELGGHGWVDGAIREIPGSLGEVEAVWAAVWLVLMGGSEIPTLRGRFVVYSWKVR